VAAVSFSLFLIFTSGFSVQYTVMLVPFPFRISTKEHTEN